MQAVCAQPWNGRRPGSPLPGAAPCVSAQVPRSLSDATTIVPANLRNSKKMKTWKEHLKECSRQYQAQKGEHKKGGAKKKAALNPDPLVVKRRVVLPAPPEPQNIRVTLVKNKKKDGKKLNIARNEYEGL